MFIRKQLAVIICGIGFLTAATSRAEVNPPASLQKQEKVFILKLDDVVDGPQGKPVSDRWQRVTDFLTGKQIKAAFGVIGYSLEQENSVYFQWIKDVQKKGLVEFWNHGFWQRTATDSIGEFEQSYAIQLRALQLTDSLAKAKLEITFSAWGPHWSGTNSDTDRALAQVPAIRLTFGAPSRPVYFKGIVIPRTLDLEYPTHNPDFSRFVAAYQKLKDKPMVSYLQGHPNSWDDKRWEEFVKIMDFLLSEGVTFLTPAEYRSRVTSGE